MKKLKILFCFVSILFLQQNLSAQMTLSAKIKGKETVKKSLGEVPVRIDIDKSNYNGICNFELIVEEQNPSAAYKRKIEITDTTGEMLYASDESGIPGVYNIDLSSVCKKISSYTIIKLMLQKNPANDKMMLPSRIIQLAEIHLK